MPKTSNRIWNFRSAGNIVDEIEEYINKYDVKEFHLEDLNPTVNEKMTKELCREIIKRNIKITWKIVSGTKAETIDKDTIAPRETATFTSVVPYFAPTHEVKWYIDGVEIRNKNQISHAFYEDGEKEIELIVSSEGCGDTIVKSVFVWEDFQLHVPNAFSPNGDGLNDVFLFKGVGVKSFSAVIVNRWGEEVYSWSDDTENGWDGTHHGIPVPAEVFTYRIVAYDYHGRAHKFFGHLTVVP